MNYTFMLFSGFRRKALTLSYDDGSASDEVIADVKKPEEAFGPRIVGMAYADGSFDDRAADILKTCGLKYCPTTKTDVSVEYFGRRYRLAAGKTTDISE